MTALAFRNVNVSPDDPVSEWPLEAIQTALERGYLSHWHRLAAAIQADPWGPVARRVEEVLTYSRPYGVAEAMERSIVRARKAAEQAERDAVATEVDALVKGSGFSRAEFASRIGTSTSRLSTYVTGKVTPSAALMMRMRRVAIPDPHDVELAKTLLKLTPEERMRALQRYVRLHGVAQEQRCRARPRARPDRRCAG